MVVHMSTMTKPKTIAIETMNKGNSEKEIELNYTVQLNYDPGKLPDVIICNNVRNLFVKCSNFEFLLIEN